MFEKWANVSRSGQKKIIHADFGPGPEAAVKGEAARGAQLDGKFGFYASRPPTSGPGPGPEPAAKGRAAGRGVCFLRLSPPTSGLARRGRRRGAQLDGEFPFYASRR